MIEAQQTPLNVVALPKPKQQQQQEPLTLEKLIERIHQILGPDGGLDSEHVDAAEIFRLMESYSSNANDWSKYAFFDHSRAYTRNLVDDGNGKVSFRRNWWSGVDRAVEAKMVVFPSSIWWFWPGVRVSKGKWLSLVCVASIKITLMCCCCCCVKSHPRSFRFALHHESAGRRAAGDTVCLAIGPGSSSRNSHRMHWCHRCCFIQCWMSTSDPIERRQAAQNNQGRNPQAESSNIHPRYGKTGVRWSCGFVSLLKFFFGGIDKIGLHRISNPNAERGAVSLHLYTPPYEVCKTFEADTGRARSSGKCSFYTIQGQRCVHQ